MARSTSACPAFRSISTPTKLLMLLKRSPHCFLAFVDGAADDHVGPGKPQSLDDKPKHDAFGAGLHLGGVEDGADAGSDAAADVADLVERGVFANLGDGGLGQPR